MDSKRAQGVTTRKAEDGEELMVPYADLSEKAKELDRGTVRAVYQAIEACRPVPSTIMPSLRDDFPELAAAFASLEERIVALEAQVNP